MLNDEQGLGYPRLPASCFLLPALFPRFRSHRILTDMFCWSADLLILAPRPRRLRAALLMVLVSLSNIRKSDSLDEETDGELFRAWTCDEILGTSLCDLDMQTDFVQVKGIHVKYWKYALKNQTENSDKLPVIVIHGGPGYPHSYLLPLKQLACTGRNVIFYDQAGCGESRLPLNHSQSVKDNYPWLVDADYYALEELPILLKHLCVERYHLLGHSWGTMLLQIFALNSTSHVREGLASMVLSGCISDSQLYIQEQWDPDTGTMGTLPPFVQERIKTLERKEAYESAEYVALDDIMTTFFTCRTAPLPDCYLEASSKMNKEIYVNMQGASEFTIGGVLTDFNATGSLHELHDLPVLLTSGKYDTVRPAVVQVMHQNLPLSENFLFDRSGHVSAIDEAVLMNQIVSDFFDRVEISFYEPGGFQPQRHVTEADFNFKQSPYRVSLSDVLCNAVTFAVGMFVMWLWGRKLRPSGYDRIQE